MPVQAFVRRIATRRPSYEPATSVLDTTASVLRYQSDRQNSVSARRGGQRGISSSHGNVLGSPLESKPLNVRAKEALFAPGTPQRAALFDT